MLREIFQLSSVILRKLQIIQNWRNVIPYGFVRKIYQRNYKNTLTEYSLSKKDIIGETDEPDEDYDLLTVILIRQGKETEEKGIFDYLRGIF